ncbi:FadR family transcriptional regulator [Leucobacter sp. UCMA 4100]|uniref:FadR/GntR family transcriptional regulator n=1 Tax=Leucobacter TaxID=55968 RepID=UPI001C24A474|nr:MULTISPECIES: GntR family transcriptional regulator [Leucobacter]MDA3146766.1 FadR family transcriptional regulator [Leucobacter sp. UCMA 4100]
MSAITRGSQKSQDTLAFLRARISQGDWAVGERIPKEPELMELIGVGKSTVREAVRSLANLGMLETIPGVGTFVRARTPVSSVLSQFLMDHDIEEVLVYRRSLEIEAAQHAAIHRTDEQLEQIREAYERLLVPGAETGSLGSLSSFHHLIVEASGSKLLQDLYLGVMSVLKKAISEGRVFHGLDDATQHRDHAAVLQAIEQRDVRNAAHSMALHVDRDLGLRVEEDMLDIQQQTERASTLIEAGFDS